VVFIFSFTINLVYHILKTEREVYFMKYVDSSAYEYIANKFHDTNKPFNPYMRFVRHDEIFDPETGMEPEKILEGIVCQDDVSLPHSVRKAKAFAYVLENTRISCDERDIFPAFNMTDRPLDKVLINKWHGEVFNEKIPYVQKKIDEIRGSFAAIIPDYCHSVPVWDRLLPLGFAGILKESQIVRKMLSEDRNLSIEENAFFDGIEITYTAILNFVLAAVSYVSLQI
jgi:hypothetical protein